MKLHQIMTNKQMAVQNLEIIVGYMKDKKDKNLDHYANMIEWQIRRLKKYKDCWLNYNSMGI